MLRVPVKGEFPYQEAGRSVVAPVGTIHNPAGCSKRDRIECGGAGDRIPSWPRRLDNSG